MKIPFSIALLKAYHAYHNVFRPQVAEIGLSVGQPKILSFLSRYDGCMQKDLAAMCDIEPATISRLLDKMDHDGLIIRSAVEGNKRAAAIFLTDKGRKRHKEAMSIRAEMEEQGLAGFSVEERELFYQFLLRFYDNLIREAGEENA